MGTWKSKNRHKYLLQYHIIFVCKYRKKLLVSRQISDDIKQFSYEICQRHSVIIRYMETDKDHIITSWLYHRPVVKSVQYFLGTLQQLIFLRNFWQKESSSRLFVRLFLRSRLIIWEIKKTLRFLPGNSTEKYRIHCGERKFLSTVIRSVHITDIIRRSARCITHRNMQKETGFFPWIQRGG